MRNMSWVALMTEFLCMHSFSQLSVVPALALANFNKDSCTWYFYNVLCILNKQQGILNNIGVFGLTSNWLISGKCLTIRVASFSIISLSYRKEDGILGGLLCAINSLSAEDHCFQLAGSLVRNEAIIFKINDDGAPLKLKPGAKCPCPPLGN